MGYIKNSYSWLELICGNHDEDTSIPMEIKIGPSSPFYACPKYYEENRTPGERKCVNRISEVDYERILAHLSDLIMEADERGEVLDLTNHEWTRNGICCKVVRHNGMDKITVRVLNKKALHK